MRLAHHNGTWYLVPFEEHAAFDQALASAIETRDDAFLEVYRRYALYHPLEIYGLYVRSAYFQWPNFPDQPRPQHYDREKNQPY